MRSKYGKQFIIGMVGYVILLPVSLLLLRSEMLAEPETAVGIIGSGLIALLPVLPFFYAMTAVIGQVREQDELNKRINLEAVLITAFLTGGLTFSYGLLQSSGILPDLPLVIIAPFMILVWGAATAIISRRYE